MKDTYLKIVDIDTVREDQAMQISLPLRYGGCGLRTHAISELQRLFVSSALLVAPAVLDATGYSIGPAILSGDAGIFCPFEYSLQHSIQSLNANGISSPDFRVGGPTAGKAWATGPSEKLYKKPKLISKQFLKICQSWRENMPKHACFRVVELELSG